MNESDIVVSLHDIEMSKTIDVDEFFFLEDHWTDDNPWELMSYQLEERKDNRTFRQETPNRWVNVGENENNQAVSLYEYSDEFKRRYEEYLPIEQRIEKNKEKEIASILQGKCPKCGRSLVLRNGKYGKFYGCSDYPNCDYSHSITDK